MKVILYIGHHKVGSTALQAFLSQNWLSLLHNGILYPSVESEGMAYSITRALQEPGGHAPPSLNIREPHNALAFQLLAQVSDIKPPKWHGNLPSVSQMIRTIRMQARYIGPHTVILCSEVMANFGPHHPELIDKIRAIFPRADFEIYCGLRRPDDYLTAWHTQRLRFGEKLLPLRDEAALNYVDTIHFDYRKLLQPWIERFPDSPIHIRPYSEILKAGGSAQDFMDQVGVDFPADLPPAERVNESLPSAAFEIVRRATHDLKPDQALALFNYLLESNSTLKPVPNNDVEMFSATLRAKLAERFAPIHDYLSDLTDRSPFFADIDEMTQARPVPEVQANADLLAQIDPENLPGKALQDYIKARQSDLSKGVNARKTPPSPPPSAPVGG